MSKTTTHKYPNGTEVTTTVYTKGELESSDYDRLDDMVYDFKCDLIEECGLSEYHAEMVLRKHLWPIVEHCMITLANNLFNEDEDIPGVEKGEF